MHVACAFVFIRAAGLCNAACSLSCVCTETPVVSVAPAAAHGACAVGM